VALVLMTMLSWTNRVHEHLDVFDDGTRVFGVPKSMSEDDIFGLFHFLEM
jgi:hypothetical protein